MNGDLALELQTAVFQRLCTDEILVGMVGKNPLLNNTPNVYDHVPDEQELGEVAGEDRRFIQVGDWSGVDYGDKDNPGQDGLFDIHCWSRYKGNMWALKMARRVVQLFHEKPLALDTGEAVLVRCAFSGMVRDPDGMSRQAVRRFRVIVSDPPPST